MKKRPGGGPEMWFKSGVPMVLTVLYPFAAWTLYAALLADVILPLQISYWCLVWVLAELFVQMWRAYCGFLVQIKFRPMLDWTLLNWGWENAKPVTTDKEGDLRHYPTLLEHRGYGVQPGPFYISCKQSRVVREGYGQLYQDADARQKAHDREAVRKGSKITVSSEDHAA